MLSLILSHPEQKRKNSYPVPTLSLIAQEFHQNRRTRYTDILHLIQPFATLANSWVPTPADTLTQKTLRRERTGESRREAFVRTQGVAWLLWSCASFHGGLMVSGWSDSEREDRDNDEKERVETLRRRWEWRGRSEKRMVEEEKRRIERVGTGGRVHRGKMACGTPSCRRTRSENAVPRILSRRLHLYLSPIRLYGHISLYIPRGIPRYVRWQRESESRARKSHGGGEGGEQRGRERMGVGDSWLLGNASSIPG